MAGDPKDQRIKELEDRVRELESEQVRQISVGDAVRENNTRFLQIMKRRSPKGKGQRAIEYFSSKTRGLFDSFATEEVHKIIIEGQQNEDDKEFNIQHLNPSYPQIYDHSMGSEFFHSALKKFERMRRDMASRQEFMEDSEEEDDDRDEEEEEAIKRATASITIPRKHKQVDM